MGRQQNPTIRDRTETVGPREALSPLDVAHLLGIGERQAREYIASGALYSFRIGRRVLVPRAALDALLAGPPQPEEQTGERP